MNLPEALSAAGLDNSEGVVQALLKLELHTATDIRLLNAAERAEMFASLRAMHVGLGSRAQLRRLVDKTTRLFEPGSTLVRDVHLSQGPDSQVFRDVRGMQEQEKQNDNGSSSSISADVRELCVSCN
jgi:hypothetical protein